MKDLLYKSVLISILDKPAKRGVKPELTVTFDDLYDSIDFGDAETQDYLQYLYGKDPHWSAEKIIVACEKKNIDIISFWDDSYPELLREIDRPPVVLYVKGEVLGHKYISVVGTRNSRDISNRNSFKIGQGLSKAGFTVVSGMALGIDRFCHMGALRGSGGTVAVLPCSIDKIYPAGNRDLYYKIMDSPSSGFVSEYPPGINSLQKWTFARRNRLISGMSNHLILVQAKEKSGAMITARCAMEQNRSILVCTGCFDDDQFSGCNSLIRDGAVFIGSMSELFSEVIPDYSYKKTIRENSETAKTDFNVEEKHILECIRSGNRNIDKIIRMGNFSASTINETMCTLELNDIVERRGNQFYLRGNM